MCCEECGELWRVWCDVESVMCCEECGQLWRVWCDVESMVCCEECDVESVVCFGECDVMTTMWGAQQMCVCVCLISRYNNYRS